MRRRLCKVGVRVGLGLALLGCVTLALAAQERYDYDALGRLVRVIDEQGRVTEYVYDAAGNLLRVVRGATVQAPAVASIAPAVLRRFETVAVIITGTGLANVAVSAADPGLDISGVRAAPNEVTFTITAAAGALLGPQTLTLRNAAGSATATVTVRPELTIVATRPQPAIFRPDGTERALEVFLSDSEPETRAIEVRSTDPALVEIVTPGVSLPAGQTTFAFRLRALAAGPATIEIRFPAVGRVFALPVYATAEDVGITTIRARAAGVVMSEAIPIPRESHSPAVGVVVQEALPAGTGIGPIHAGPVGVAVGAVATALAPSGVVEKSTTVVTVQGRELDRVTAASVVVGSATNPYTVGPLAPTPDGRALQVPINSSGGGVLARLELYAGAARVEFAPDGGARLVPASGLPVVSAITPATVAAGSTFLLRVVGAHLAPSTVALPPGYPATTVTIEPPDGIVVNAATLQIDPVKGWLDVSVTVLPGAPPRPRIVRVIAPAGPSTAASPDADVLAITP